MENDHFSVALQIIVAFLWAITIKLSTYFFSLECLHRWLGHLVLELLSKEISFQVKRVVGNISDVPFCCMHFAHFLLALPEGMSLCASDFM